MRHLKVILLLPFIFAVMISCDEINQVDYVAPVKITFEGVDESNIVQVAKGISSYTTNVNIQSAGKIRSVSLYEVDIRTGASGAQIGNDTIFDPAVDNYSFSYDVQNLDRDKAIMVMVEDENSKTFSKKLYVKITAEVYASNLLVIESADAYYGVYFASWLYGRAYLVREAAQYTDEIDFSFGNVAITGTDTVAAFVSPDRRQELKLPYVPNVKSCKFELTTLTRANFDAILPSDGTVIKDLPAPTQTLLKAENGKVYLYENDKERGLVYIAALRARKEPLQQQDGSWVKNQTYHELRIYTKTVAKN